MIYTDTEAAMRTWLRNHPRLTNLAGRVFFGIDEDNTSFPLIELYIIGTGADFGNVPVERVRLSINVWAKSKKAASETVRAVALSLREMENESLDASTYGYFAEVDNIRWLPDDEEGLARYVLDATIAVRAVN